ncbi:hypothetical protein [Paenibacillus glycinis]|uniref:Uncharacterized protein n=1 Tax=Paenibacillus glycinis TaxID=2697035 RepID=A0ABW9XRS5_9BACL|nr:hypothetical protein [Paenibacillus glycinis]NBD25173.1 hypothetical protein [Paenibacillus glycinis]
MLWISLIAAACVVRYQYPKLKRRKQLKELWLSASILVFALGLSVAQSFHAPIPNPLDWITAIYKPMSKVVLSALS